MGPRSNPFWEFWSLAFWWAAWSLADTYLLPLTPLSEVAVLWICIIIAGTVRLAECVERCPRRYTERIQEVDPDPPPPPPRERGQDDGGAAKRVGPDAV